ncbi:hypothetical protein [Tritonibacter multivorans]|nr:hypothetical protein [Tritonibacter multivorans]MDA7421882.1 hypothetical protein [Tritonibacter multivorans]
MPNPTDPLNIRNLLAEEIRKDAAALSTGYPPEKSVPNSNQTKPYIFNFTKGFEHGINGLMVDPHEYDDFIDGTDSHDPLPFSRANAFRGEHHTARAEGKDPEAMPGMDRHREWESPTAGHAFVLEGPDPQAIPMPPAPEAGSTELAAEIAEVYQMALARDWCLAAFMPKDLVHNLKPASGGKLSSKEKDAIHACHDKVKHAIKTLSDLRWFKGETNKLDIGDPLQRARRRCGHAPTLSTLFRGKGEDAGPTPFLSQFMVMGSGGAKRDFTARATGKIAFGAQQIDQKVNIAIPGKDYMTTWIDYVDVLNGANVRRKNAPSEILQGKTRPIATIRDMATYVHDDALYQAYLNAALILLDEGFATDRGIPYHKHSEQADPIKANREPFALFGGPHLLTLVTEVSSRALKAVRYQKFTVHRRHRPEHTAALLHTVLSGYEPHRDLKNDKRFKGQVKPYAQGDGSFEATARRQLGNTIAHYVDSPGASTTPGEPALYAILEEVRKHNADQNKKHYAPQPHHNWLLPMAFAEGSPMHPAYGAGHATVAGACVTLLKAFFAMTNDDGTPVKLVEDREHALVPGCPAQSKTPEDVRLLAVQMDNGLTLEGELNKLIWNISNARNMGGVHFYTDYIESALLGEAITIGILREQMLCYHPNEAVSMTVPLIVPRKLPAALLSGPTNLTPHDIVSAVVINSDGSLSAA